MGIGRSGRAHDHDLCIILRNDRNYHKIQCDHSAHGLLDEESPFQCSLGVSDNVRIARRSRVGLMS